MDYDYWEALSDESELLNAFEQDHDKGQRFDDWLAEMIKYGFIRYGNDGNLYRKI